MGKKIILTLVVILLAEILVSLALLASPYENFTIAKSEDRASFSREQEIGDYISGKALATNKPPQDAELTLEEDRVTVFVPHRHGEVLDEAAMRHGIIEQISLGKDYKNLESRVRTSEPKVSLASLNDLGINELLASGKSDFAGSPANRIHNIRVGAARYNGVIVKPGEEFSFNKYLGPVDGSHGFLPELVIKPEGTMPEFGGGLCQVSTTAFRAAFFGGLPITQRKNHSYAVKYYEWIGDDKPRAVGLDATIYPGAVDMKFMNDTDGSLLIWTRVEGNRLYFDFYGTRDAREVVVDGPHPFDKKASGAVKSKVSRTVIKDDEKQDMTFNSNYVSPNLYPRIYEFPKPLEQQP